MRTRTILLSLLPLIVVGAMVGISSSATASPHANVVRTIPKAGTTTLRQVALGRDVLQFPELPVFLGGSNTRGPAQSGKRSLDPIVDHAYAVARGHGPTVHRSGSRSTKFTLQQLASFDGLRHRDQRLANGGNQFSLEPPDQGLCVGNGFVLEPVNDVLRVYSTSGAPASGVVDLNTFYGYPAQFNRTTGEQGPFLTDPECLFDQATQRWFVSVLTLDVVPDTGEFTGKNHLDVAVSTSPSPLGSFNIYRIPVQDDGTDGTPNHHCPPGIGTTNPNACLGDFPHIAADKYGFFITTNEYAFFDPNDTFHGAQVYAFAKAQLAAGASVLTMVQFDTNGLDEGKSGFTLWPAKAPGRSFASDNGGTEFFLSSNAAEEAQEPPAPGTPAPSTDLLVWATTNTRSLNSTPALSLTHTVLTVNQYFTPPKADQKAGDIPLGQCINDTTLPTPFGPGCWQFFFVTEPAHDEVESHLDSGDTRIQTVWFQDGTLFGALDTVVNIGGVDKAGIAWYIVDVSHQKAHGLKARLARQGVLAVANNNVTYPAIAVNTEGQGVMAFTIVGADHYPGAAYAPISRAGVGSIKIAAEGLGPSDGFTSYKAFVGNPPRTRWGDYGAATVDGKNLWIASEYIGQTCTFAQYVASPFGSCGATRTSLGNWFTRITSLRGED